MTFDELRERKALEIVLALLNGAKGIREIRDAVEGSYTTITKRVEKLRKVGILTEEYSSRIEYGDKAFPKRLIRLSDEGRRLINSLIESGFLRKPLLQKHRQKWIILLLNILRIVKGRTRLMKLLFLLKFKFSVKKENSFRFKPWIYGPYSKDVTEDLRDLRDDGLIVEKQESYRTDEYKEEEILYIYTLTPRGEKLVQELSEKIPQSTLKILGNLRPFNEMTLDRLLKYIYNQFPEFVTYSTIVERVLANHSISENDAPQP